MNFIIGLPESQSKNAICIIVDRFNKKRHYIPCTTEDEGTTAEETIWILIWNIYRLHNLPSSIVSDRDL